MQIISLHLSSWSMADGGMPCSWQFRPLYDFLRINIVSGLIAPRVMGLWQILDLSSATLFTSSARSPMCSCMTCCLPHPKVEYVKKNLGVYCPVEINL